MAQETRVNPIQLDNTASQIMMNMANSIDNTNYRNRALEAEKEKERMRIEAEEQKRIAQQNRETLNSLFDPTKLREETRAVMVKDILANTTAVLRGGVKGGTTPEVAEQAMQALLNISAGDAKYANILKNIDEREKSMTDDEKKGFNIGEAKQVAIRNAFKKQDAKGNWVPKPIEELDDTQDYLGTLINSPDGLKFANLSVGYNELTENIKKAPTATETFNIKTQRGREIKTEAQTITYSPEYQVYDPKTQQIKLNTDENGLISDSIYKKETSNPSINRMLISRAQNFVEDFNTADDKGKVAMAAKAGIPAGAKLPAVLDKQDPKVLEVIKKSFLTETISNQIGKKESEKKQDIILPPPTNNYYNNDPTNAAPNDRITSIISLDSRYLGPAVKTKGGNMMYNVTEQFNNLPLFKSRRGSYGPAEVQYNSGTQQFFVRESEGAPLEAYDIQSWRDIVIPRTSGTGYNPKPKKPNPLAPKK
jgi:hypothetical protein